MHRLEKKSSKRDNPAIQHCSRPTSPSPAPLSIPLSCASSHAHHIMDKGDMQQNPHQNLAETALGRELVLPAKHTKSPSPRPHSRRKYAGSAWISLSPSREKEGRRTRDGVCMYVCMYVCVRYAISGHGQTETRMNNRSTQQQTLTTIVLPRPRSPSITLRASLLSSLTEMHCVFNGFICMALRVYFKKRQ
jgi:hypothetical protein